MQDDLTWRRTAAAQDSMLTRSQLAACGVSRRAVAHRLAKGVWTAVSPTVVAVQSGELGIGQRHWLGVLHGGEGSLIGGLTAAEVRGLRGWSRDEINVLVPESRGSVRRMPGFEFIRTRHNLDQMRRHRGRAPVAALEPSVLPWAARQKSERTSRGVVAAVLQQRLTTTDALDGWLERLAPLRHSRLLRGAISDFRGGIQSVAEADVRRMCRRHGLAPPARQTRRLDAHGRMRFTDCEWRLSDGRTIVIEVDGSFHMDADAWAADLARARALTAPDRIVLRCTHVELRDRDSQVAEDLRRLGVRNVA